MKKQNWLIIITGAVIGVMALLLTHFGNPANMGFCIACFLRDTAGALGLHGAGAVQYIRPEIIGIILGAFIIALIKKEFKPTGGSSPMTRFVLGFFVMVGALMFLGCPLRMVIRIGGGDLNALVGLVGFIGGILLGVVALNKGFSLKRAYKQRPVEGVIFPAIAVLMLVLLLAAPSFIKFSEEGPGSKHAFWAIALGAGLVVGVLAQRSRMCMAGGIRNAVMFKDFSLVWGSVAILVVVIIGNLIPGVGNFKLGFAEQNIAHTDGIWNFLGMALVGWGSVLLGGCPMRQLVLAGEGNSDSAVTVLGMVVGADLCHNFGLASSGEGPTVNGMVAVVIGLVITAVISVVNCKKEA